MRLRPGRSSYFVMPHLPSTDEFRQRVLDMVRLAEASLPREDMPDLPPGRLTQGEEWHPFEHAIWRIGEGIRQLMNEKPSLRGDPELLGAFQRIACNSRAKRGRQTFVLLFAYRACAPFARTLIQEINDPHVCGHVIDALLKMRASGLVDQVEPYIGHERTWIRNKAKQYCARYGA